MNSRICREELVASAHGPAQKGPKVLTGFEPTWSSLAVVAAALGMYLLYILAMAAVLAICGVPRPEIGKWALKQADRQRFVDLVRAARHEPSDRPPP